MQRLYIINMTEQTDQNFYSKEYGKLTLSVLKDNVDDLSKWSVNNGDKFIEEIAIIENLITEMEGDFK